MACEFCGHRDGLLYSDFGPTLCVDMDACWARWVDANPDEAAEFRRMEYELKRALLPVGDDDE